MRGIFILSLLLTLMACNEVDVAVVNQVKSFEPKWMDLSSKTEYLDRNLNMTKDRYDKTFLELSKTTTQTGEKADSAAKANIRTFSPNYKKNMEERDLIEKNFLSYKNQFTQTVNQFNNWTNLVMQNKVSSEEAKVQLAKYQTSYAQIEKELGLIEKRLQKNVEKHNNLTKGLTQSTGSFASYHLDLR